VGSGREISSPPFLLQLNSSLAFQPPYSPASGQLKEDVVKEDVVKEDVPLSALSQLFVNISSKRCCLC
jgi:hypothetical protein